MANHKLETTEGVNTIQATPKFTNVEQALTTAAFEYVVGSTDINISIITDGVTFSDTETGVYLPALNVTIPVLRMTSIWLKASSSVTAQMSIARGI